MSLYKKHILAVVSVSFVVIGLFSLASYEINRRQVEEVTAAIWFIVMFFFTGAILSLALYFLIRRQIGRPLEQISSEIMAVADGRAIQVSDGGSDVAPDIASSVNRLAAELRKAKEDVLRSESRELSHMERMASIGEVAAIVAHEIKNPLAGISGALQVMAEDIPDDSPRKEICNEILSEIDRLDRTVKDLIAYAKPQEINPLLSDLNAVVDRAVRAISPAAQLKHISVGLHAGTIPDIMVDPERMGKVVSDILLYQCTLMPDGGQIEVSTVLDQERDEIGIFSTDTGQTMTGDKIRGIFKPSFSRHSGAGLSLAIGSNIVESHGGRIGVESGFGIGNTFHIIIPVKG